MNATEATTELELLDLGNAMEETKHCSPFPLWVDSVFGYGTSDYPYDCPYG